jgi:hypothetical protein
VARSLRHQWYPESACDLDRSSALNPAVFEAEQAGARGLRGVHFIDLTDRLCSGNRCPAVRNGQPVYRDDNHLTGRFAESLTPDLELQLLPILEAAPGYGVALLKRRTDRSFAFLRSSSRDLGGAEVTRDAISRSAEAVTSSTAR